MKRNIILIIALFIILPVISCSSDKEITCTIKGRVIGRNSEAILLTKATDDPRFGQITIPIKDSTFEYKLVIPQTECYSLIFKDEWDKGFMRSIYFFPEKGVVNFKLYTFDEFSKNQVNGGKLNEEYSNYRETVENKLEEMYKPTNESITALRNENKFFSEQAIHLQKEIEQSKDPDTKKVLDMKYEELSSSGEDLTPAGKILREKNEATTREFFIMRKDFVEHHPSIVSYFLLFQDYQTLEYNKNVNLEYIKKNFSILSSKFPEHPYTQLFKTMLASNSAIKVGGKFIDFSAPDLNGNLVRLSDVIKNKVALIDLWATWCGSCIVASRSMIPVYEEYKDKGFTICGVAAEINNTDQLKERLKIEKFPWINLVDLDKKNQIWLKYGVPNAGGVRFS